MWNGAFFLSFIPKQIAGEVITPAAINKLILSIWHLNVEGKITSKIIYLTAPNRLFLNPYLPNVKVEIVFSDRNDGSLVYYSERNMVWVPKLPSSRRGGGGERHLTPSPPSYKTWQGLPGCARYLKLRRWLLNRIWFVDNHTKKEGIVNSLITMYRPANDPRTGNDPQIEPQMILGREMIPRLDRKWSPIASP